MEPSKYKLLNYASIVVVTDSGLPLDRICLPYAMGYCVDVVRGKYYNIMLFNVYIESFDSDFKLKGLHCSRLYGLRMFCKSFDACGTFFPSIKMYQ